VLHGAIVPHTQVVGGLFPPHGEIRLPDVAKQEIEHRATFQPFEFHDARREGLVGCCQSDRNSSPMDAAIAAAA